METAEISLSYPIGRFKAPEINGEAIAQAIAQIEALPGQLAQAVKGLNDEQLDTPYRPEGWTVRQVVHHLPDSHMNAYIRLKLALTEDTPVIKPYAEAEWARLPDAKGEIDASLRLLTALHERLVLLMRSMRPADWEREFYHPENKNYTSLGRMACLYAWHGRHHLAHITRLKERMGW